MTKKVCVGGLGPRALDYLTWLEYIIRKWEEELQAAEGLLKRAQIQGRLDGLRDARKMYLEKACDDGR